MLSVVFPGTHRDKYDGGLLMISSLMVSAIQSTRRYSEQFAWRKALVSMRMLRGCICLGADIDIVRVFLAVRHVPRKGNCLIQSRQYTRKTMKSPFHWLEDARANRLTSLKKGRIDDREKSAQVHAKKCEPQPPFPKAPRIDPLAMTN